MRWISVLILASVSGLAAQTAANSKIDYDRHVKPILAAHCFSCHGPVQQQSGLRLDLRQNALRGGDYGVVINPGDGAGSKLILRLAGSTAGLQMPPAGPLTPEEIGILRAWIDQGADMPGRAIEYTAPKKTDPKTQAFIDAIHRHDTAGFERGLKEDPSLAKAADANGSTTLMHAAYAGTVSMVRALLAAGAGPKATNSRNATALHWAVTDPDKVKLLIAAGADVNAKTIEGRTVLYLSAMRPAGAGVARILLDAGADANARTLAGVTPLFPATGASLDTLGLLLDNGADPKAKTGTGATALMSAALANPQAVALLIGRGADVKARTKRGETALANAANYGSFESAKLLLDKGAEVNAADYRGYTPLMHAAYCDNAPVELIRLLLDAGADVNATGEGETALSIAAKRGETETTRLLREAQKGAIALSALLLPAMSPAADLSAGVLRSAVQKGLDLIEKTSPTFIKKGGCNSCHHQMLGAAAQAMARARGIPTGEPIEQLPPEVNEFTTERLIEYSMFGVNSVGYELFAYAKSGRPLDARIEALVYYVKSLQEEAGHWHTTGNRPPLTLDDFTTTAFAIHALNAYTPEAQRADSEARIARARSWLLEAQPRTTQEKAFHLLGLAWSQAPRAALDRSASGLQTMQRKDGGWSQLPGMPPDAFATGLALYAMAEGGVPASHASYRKGLNFLIETQAPDGTWHVKSRALPVQPYFESGYPYGHDQWISTAGTAYAVMAITAALEPPRRAQR